VSDFPRLQYMLDDSTCETQSGHDFVRATNGALHVRRYFNDEKRMWLLSFFLSATSREDLQDHYDDNKDGQFDFYWPGDDATYTASYIAAPEYAKAGPQYVRARVQLMER
jgi:hypothetical protein